VVISLVSHGDMLITRAVPNIRFVFTSGPNNGPHSYSVFGRIVAEGPNTNNGHWSLIKPIVLRFFGLE